MSQTAEVAVAGAYMGLHPFWLSGAGPTMQSGLAGLEAWQERTGYYNLELVPGEIALDLLRAENVERAQAVFGSSHESFNSGHGLVGTVLSYAGVYLQERSLPVMRAYHALSLGKPLPAVVYPESIKKDEPLLEAALCCFQPKADMYPEGTDLAVEALVDRAGGTIPYLCPDTEHTRGIPGWEDLWLDYFTSGLAVQMHIGVGRSDQYRGRQEARDETAVFLGKSFRHPLDTQLGQMVLEALQAWELPAAMNGLYRVVIEMPPRLWRNAEANKRVIDAIARIIVDSGAKPLLRADRVE